MKEAHVLESQLHTEQQSPGHCPALLLLPCSEVHGTPFETPVRLYPQPVGRDHVRFGYLFPDVSTPAPLWSAHLTHGRTEDIPDLLLCNEPQELLKPLQRGEQNLSTTDETETFSSQRGHSALPEQVALDTALFYQNSFCVWNVLSSILQMLLFSISPTIQFLFLFFLFNPFLKKYLCTLKINKLIWEHW